MVPNANARHFLLKAKQRDLIAACGGIERASAVCNFSKSAVGRWAHADSPDLMPLDAIFALEEECGRHDMSEAIAAARGKLFADVEIAGDAANACLMSSHAATLVLFGELVSAGAMAFADGRVTPAEASQIDRLAAQVERGLDELRRATAAARGAGGVDLTGKS